jgi:hypothetical protein
LPPIQPPGQEFWLNLDPYTANKLLAKKPDGEREFLSVDELSFFNLLLRKGEGYCKNNNKKKALILKDVEIFWKIVERC